MNPAALAPEAWHDHVYLRDNPCGPHWEWWHHVAGCRRWIRVQRDTETHAILGAAPAVGPLPGADR